MTTDDDLPDPGEIRDEEIPGLLRSLALVGCRHSTMTATVINCLRLAADELERLRAEACLYYNADGTSVRYESADEVRMLRILSAKELARLRAEVASLKAERASSWTKAHQDWDGY